MLTTTGNGVVIVVGIALNIQSNKWRSTECRRIIEPATQTMKDLHNILTHTNWFMNKKFSKALTQAKCFVDSHAVGLLISCSFSLKLDAIAICKPKEYLYQYFASASTNTCTYRLHVIPLLIL